MTLFHNKNYNKNIISLLIQINNQEKEQKDKLDKLDIIRKKITTYKGRLFLKNKKKTLLSQQARIKNSYKA